MDETSIPSPAIAAAPGAEDDIVQLSGVDGTTGQYLAAARPTAEIAAEARAAMPQQLPDAVVAAETRVRLEQFGLPADVDPNDLRRTGWGIVFADDVAPAVRDALAPLIAHRRQQIGDKMAKVLDYRRGEGVRDWLTRHEVSFGSVRPRRVPYHLLLVGSPSSLPFDFQFLLDLEYSVGRIHFDDDAGYARYADAVIRYETAATLPTQKELVFWAPEHFGDRATALSVSSLIEPLQAGDGEDDPVAKAFGYATRSLIGPDATCAALRDALHGAASRPAVIFTAGHGLGFAASDPQQHARQGALLGQEWTGIGTIRDEHAVAASDIRDDANLHGLVLFLFACFGAGTPQRDLFPKDLVAAPPAIAPAPFVAALPQRLLGHPAGGALAVLGHVDRAWGFSIAPITGDPQIVPFRNALARLLAGQCIGNATRDFGERHAILSAELVARFAPGAAAGDDRAIVRLWIERNDAGSYVLLGDPAARLRTT